MPIFHEHIISNEKNNHKVKQYTTPEQTAKLIELGFKPESIEFASDCEVVNEYGIERIECINPQFSIGELIDVLGVHLSSIYYIGIEWFVNAEGIERRRDELIDALYDMVVNLKEGGVIWRDEGVKIKAQDNIKSELCEVALAQPKPQKQKDAYFYQESDNNHFEAMKQINDIMNKIQEEED